MSDAREWCQTCQSYHRSGEPHLFLEDLSSFAAPAGSAAPGQIAPERALAWDILSALDAANMGVNHPAKAAVDVIEGAIRRAQENG